MILRLLAALVAVFSMAEATSSISAIYKCSDEDYANCFTELQSCTAFYNFIGEPHRVCDCYEESFLCFNDCQRFPGDHYRRCYELCPPPSTKCTPDTTYVGRSAASSITPGTLYYFVTGGVVLATLLQLAMTYVTFGDKIL